MRPGPARLDQARTVTKVTPGRACQNFVPILVVPSPAMSKNACAAVTEGTIVAYLRVTLSALAAVIVALLGPTSVQAFQEGNNSRATGFAAVVGDALESFFTPLFWVIALALFALFLATSRLSSRALRTILFWIPVTTISTLGFGIFALFAYLWVQIRNR